MTNEKLCVGIVLTTASGTQNNLPSSRLWQSAKPARFCTCVGELRSLLIAQISNKKRRPMPSFLLLSNEKLCARHFLTADAVPKKCCFARDSGRPLCFAFRLLRRTTFASRPNIMQNKKVTVKVTFYFGDPDENRTRVTAVKGRCLNRLTTGPYALSLLGKGFVCLVAVVGLEPTTCRV